MIKFLYHIYQDTDYFGLDHPMTCVVLTSEDYWNANHCVADGETDAEAAVLDILSQRYCLEARSDSDYEVLLRFIDTEDANDIVSPEELEAMFATDPNISQDRSMDQWLRSN